MKDQFTTVTPDIPMFPATSAPPTTTTVPQVTANDVVVLVEDDMALLQMYQERLTNDGFVVYTADNGADGYKLVEQHKPSVVLCDIMMPCATGIDLLQMKQNSMDEFVRRIPVIMLTDHTAQGSKQAAMQFGVTDFIAKDEEQPRDVVSRIKQTIEK